MPEPDAVDESVTALARVFEQGNVVVLTGAGVSTDSGIPAYRDEEGRWKQSAPMQFRDFVGTQLARQRYWARSMVGWARMARAEPNPAHRALSELEQRHQPHFLRVHRNALVARRLIRALEKHHDAEEGEGWAVRLQGVDEAVAISRRQLAVVRELLASS
mgnify:CR=1 FL=1